jgi:hypothetical protein
LEPQQQIGKYTKVSEEKQIPKFESEDQEREFWDTHDSTEYIDWSKARWATLSNLKPSTRTISVHLPEALLDTEFTDRD